MVENYIDSVGDFQIGILLIIAVITFSVWHILTKKFKDSRPKWLLLSIYTGIFFYSGWGIAFKNIPDSYILIYTVFILTFGLPFLIFNKSIVKRKNNLCSFDRSLLRNESVLEYIAVLYLFLQFVPLIYPNFRLFEIFSFKTESIHTLRDAQKGDVVLTICDLISIILTPFFYAFFTVNEVKQPATRKPIVFFLILLLLEFGRYNYIGRNEMILDLANIFLILFCVKGFRYKISWKVLASGIGAIILMIPFLYLYTFFRMGVTYTGDASFSTMFDLLIKSEFFYPIFYERILTGANQFHETLLDFVSYIVCLPIPNAIWPDKPSYDAISTFTYVFTGLERGDTGFFILLPSIMGESLIYGGDSFFWVFSIISGYIVSRIFRYLCSKKTLTYYTFFIIVYAFTYARGGTMGLVATLINGTLWIYIFDKIISLKKQSLSYMMTVKQ